jgi:hypothetical protein
MTPARQGELFSEPADNGETPTYYPDPDEVRGDLQKILAEARGAEAMPWNGERLALYRCIFPQMTNCLPDCEAAEFRSQFETELARLSSPAPGP